MGKVRRLRKKFHLACQKSQSDQVATPVVPVVSSIPGQTEVPVKLSSDSNIFAGITISFSDLQQKLPPPTPVLGTVSEPSVSGDQTSKSTNQSNTRHVPKKEKRLARREALLRKIDTVRQLKQEATKKKQPTKKKEVKPMLMTSLIDALPIFTPNDVKNQSDSGKKAGKNSKVKSCLPKKKRKKQFMDNMKAYKSVLCNSHYKADPTSAISNYLLRTVSQNSTWVKKP